MQKTLLALAAMVSLLALSVACGGSPTNTPVPETTPTHESPLSLEVLSLPEESVVHTPLLEVRGRTALDAVVTVNGQPVEVNDDGSFTTTLELEGGPNLIEVIASDFQGRQTSRVLTAIYAT